MSSYFLYYRRRDIARFLRPPEASFFLLGLRGVGKSTWAQEAFPQASRVDLLDQRLYQDLLADPSLFAQAIQHLPGSWVLVDEVQRLPAERSPPAHRGAPAALRVARLECPQTEGGRGESAGRTGTPAHHVPAHGERTGGRLRRGFFATGRCRWSASPRPREVLEAWVLLYLQEEIRAEAAARNLPGFARFLPVAALLNGQTVNVSGIARDAGVAYHGARLSGHSGGHAPGAPAAGVRLPAPGARASRSQVVLLCAR